MAEAGAQDCPRCKVLADRVAFLEAECAEALAIARRDALRAELGLRPAGAVLLLALHDAGKRGLTFATLAALGTRGPMNAGALRVAIRRIREAAGDNLIETRRGDGYRITAGGARRVAAAIEA